MSTILDYSSLIKNIDFVTAHYCAGPVGYNNSGDILGKGVESKYIPYNTLKRGWSQYIA